MVSSMAPPKPGTIPIDCINFDFLYIVSQFEMYIPVERIFDQKEISIPKFEISRWGDLQ